MERRDIFCAGQDARLNGKIDRAELVRRLLAGFNPNGRSDALVAAMADGFVAPGKTIPKRAPHPAAVLVPLVMRQDGLHVLLTQRTKHLHHHPGQISFPGGRMEDEDLGDAVRAALRETSEETGITEEYVDVIGRLDDYITITGFTIVPVVGLVRPDFVIKKDDFEVAEVFEVPLSYVLNPASRKLHRVVHEGNKRAFWAFEWAEDKFIWGATAAILVNLAEVLDK